MSKSQIALFIQLLLAHYVTQGQQDIKVVCGPDVALPCPGIDSKRGNFISVVWYKISERKLGIVRWSGNSTRYYNFSREARFGEDYSLMLPRVAPEDSGTYVCAIKANVGGQNQYLNVNLTVHECETQFEKTTATSVSNSSVCSFPCHNEVHDVPLLWSAMGYLAVAVAKIALSLMSVWVIHKRAST